MRALDGSLRRLRTDRIDVYFNHAVNDVARLAEPRVGRVHRAREAAGQDPLHRHVGPRRAARRVPRLRARSRPRRRRAGRPQLRPGPGLLRALHAAASTSSPCSPSCRACSRRRSEKNVGVDRDEDAARRAPERHAPLRARGRHVRAGRVPLGASRPHVDALVVTMTSTEQVDEYLGASGWPRVARGRPAAARALRARATARRSAATAAAPARARARTACRSTTCCARACTPRTTASRARARRARRGGRRDRLPHLHGAPCASACPHGLAIPELTK